MLNHMFRDLAADNAQLVMLRFQRARRSRMNPRLPLLLPIPVLH